MTEVEATPTFVSRGWYRVRGRGWVASVACDRERPRDKPGLEGHAVVIDGEVFDCVAVERFLPLRPIAPGEQIGLLVKERNEKQ